MPRNVYFSQGTTPEKRLYEDITIEALKIYGHDVYYIPRKIVNTNSIFNEDALSEFGSAYQIEMYVENTDGFEGDGDLLSKFGVEVRDSMTLVIATRRWEELVGRFQNPVEARPQEGDLIYFPLVKGLFQITFVEDESPFYQISNLPTFKLSCELFEYGNEAIDTGVEEIDAFETQFSVAQQVLSLTGFVGMNTAGYDDEVQSIYNNASGLEGIPILGSTVESTIDGVKVTGEVKEILETKPYIIWPVRSTGSSYTGQYHYAYYEELPSWAQGISVDHGVFIQTTPGGVSYISKFGHPQNVLDAGGVEGTWAFWRPGDTSDVIATNLGTGEFPDASFDNNYDAFIVHKRPSKISLYGIERADGGSQGFTSGASLTPLGLPDIKSPVSRNATSLTIDSIDDSTATGFSEMQKTDPYADNQDFETIGNNFIDFSESNPFGEVNI